MASSSKHSFRNPEVLAGLGKQRDGRALRLLARRTANRQTVQHYFPSETFGQETGSTGNTWPGGPVPGPRGSRTRAPLALSWLRPFPNRTSDPSCFRAKPTPPVSPAQPGEVNITNKSGLPWGQTEEEGGVRGEGSEAGKEAGAKSEIGALERLKQRRASAGGECHARKGTRKGGGRVLNSGARRKVTRPVRLPSFSYLGTKFSRSESSQTSPKKSSALFWRSSSFPSCDRDWAAVEPRTLQIKKLKKKRFHRGKGRRLARRRVGVGTTAHNEGPLERSTKFLKPTCWNARRRRLLHSGPNVFVIIPDRLPARAACAPALGRATPAHCGTGARSPSHFTDPANGWGVPPNPRPRPRPLCSSCSRPGCAVSGPGSHPALCAVQ